MFLKVQLTHVVCAVALIGCGGRSGRHTDADTADSAPADGGNADLRSDNDNGADSDIGRPPCADDVFRLTVVGHGRVDTTGALASTCEPVVPLGQNPEPLICTYQGCGNYGLKATPASGWAFSGWQGDCEEKADGSATTAPRGKASYACSAVFVEVDAGESDAGMDVSGD
jgi:hypothetical protein